MRTSSAVLLHTQRPPMMFGLPPALALLAAAGVGLSFALCVLAGALPVSLIVGAVVGLSLWMWFWRRVREDIHFDRVLLKTTRFWGGKRDRTLVAGRGLH